MANFKMKTGAKVTLAALIVLIVFACIWKFKKPETKNSVTDSLKTNIDTVKNTASTPSVNVNNYEAITSTVSANNYNKNVESTTSVSATVKNENNLTTKEKHKSKNVEPVKSKEKKKDKDRENLNVSY